MQKQAVFHVEFRTAADDVSFQFELDDTDGLVHLSHQTQRLIVVWVVLWVCFRTEEFAGVVGVSLHGKGGQREQVNTIAIFQSCQISVSHGQTKGVGDAAVISGSGTHPKNIMVTPLDIEIVVVTKGIHDDVRAGTTVEYIS